MTEGWTNSQAQGDDAMPDQSYATEAGEPEPGDAETAASETDVSQDLPANANSWRVEVAARVQRYRTRRKPRTPRYPSLLLPFDAPENDSHPATPTPSPGTASAATGAPSLVEPRQTPERQMSERPTSDRRIAHRDTSDRRTAERHTSEPGPLPYPEPTQELSAKVLEFPRSAAIPVFRRDALADPVFDDDRPRIVEAPEIRLLPPALGGMTIEPAVQEPGGERVNFPTPVPSASIAQRALAALVDGVVLAIGLAGFVAIALRLNPSLGPVRGLLPVLAGPKSAGSILAGSTPAGPTLVFALGLIAVLLWAIYQFWFVVCIGATLGLRAVGLHLATFDGSPLHRRARLWRVLASFLCIFSGGLGYLWCFLDQDGLCWHDRITRSHLQSL
ncbi:MAG: RDD family protein [Terriglobales bacterium]